MKKIIFALAVLGLAGCKGVEPQGDGPVKATLNLAVEGFAGHTRSAANYGIEDYFVGWENDLKNIEVTFDGVTKAHTYAAGKLTSVDAAEFYFPTGGASVSIAVKWPVSAQRKDVSDETRKDQSTKAAFMAEDWLICEMPTVMPAYSVPVFLKHQRAKIAFVAGEGLAVPESAELGIAGFKAYCADGHAEIIVDPTEDAEAFAADTAGTLKIGDTTYNFKLVEAITGFAAGSYHEVTLSL